MDVSVCYPTLSIHVVLLPGAFRHGPAWLKGEVGLTAISGKPTKHVVMFCNKKQL